MVAGCSQVFCILCWTKYGCMVDDACRQFRKESRLKNPSGLCECGCGQPAPPSKYAHHGYRVGDPLRFIKGHRKATAETRAKQSASLLKVPRRDVMERFWEKVDKNGPTVKPELGPCWRWLAGTDTSGYGRFRVGGRYVSAHRWLYGQTHSPIARELVSDHLCRVHNCVNPGHIDPVTSKVNTQRGNSGQWQRDTTHCPSGHEYTPENIYMYHGSRHCRACRTIAWQQRNEKLKRERKERKNGRIGNSNFIPPDSSNAEATGIGGAI